DGNNLLGAMRVDRHAEEPKRNLLRLLAGFARARRTRVTCIFDGPEPGNFGRHLGAVTALFSGTRSADDLIAERASQGRGWSVVTSDRQLSARIQRRQVEVVEANVFIRQMEESASGEEGGGDDWESWFSDPKNRMDF
ncbi:MAG TPA: NYN domain-containing protein, partial [Thermoanaerobaculia bacterium]